MHKITDQTLIDKFKAEKEHAALSATLSDLIKTGDDLYKSLFSYKPDYGNPLITRANGGYGEEPTDDAQIMFDEVSYLGGENNDKYERLFYDDNTYIRGAGGIHLRFDEPKQDLKLFYFAKGGEGLGFVNVEGMNTVAGDTHYNTMLVRFNMDMNRSSDWTSIHLDRPCDRVYFRVQCNSTGGRFFTLNYIVVYEAVVDEGASLYHKTTGLKEPADKLSALIAAKKEIVEAGSATNEDIKELEGAILAVKALLSPASVELQQLIDDYGSEGDFVGGTDPGYYQEDVVQEYNNVLRESKKFVMNQHSEDELQAQIDKLKAAHARLASALIPITEGYYYLVNGFDDFFNKFGVEKAAYATTETLRYDTFDSENSKFVFHITETGNDNEFSLEHVLTGAFVGQDWGATYNSTCMDTKGTGIVQEFSLKSPGKWSWADVRNNASKSPYATDSPVADNSEGPLATWAGSDSRSNLWYLRKITDQDFIDKVINEKAEKQPLWDELDNIIAKAGSYPLGNDYGQFSYDKSFYDVIPLAIQVSQRRTATAEEIQYWIDAVSDCISKLALNMPAEGALIRIKDSNGNYMTCNNNSSNSNRIEFSATKDDALIFCYTGDALVSYKTGLYASNTTGVRPFPTNAASVITEGEATLYHILQSGLTLGKYLVSFGSDTRFMYTNADAGTFSSASNISNTGYEFTIEAVESIPVTIGGARVATLYSPQALIIPEGVTAYTGTYTGNSIQLTPLTDDIIPANTGVIVEGEANTTYNFYITNGGEGATSCLGGTVPAISTTSGAYTLQIVDGQLGFYRYTGENLAGFKAFFTNSTGAKGFSLVKGDFTGINGVVDNQIEGVYYDLMGNMVKHPLKNHIYIFNGTKVLK